MAQSTGSIKTWVVDSIYNIPTTVNSGTNIQDWVERGKRFVQNWTGETISSTSVPEKYQNLLFYYGAASTLSKMVGANVDFNVRVGEFTATKTPPDNPDTVQMKHYLEQANAELIAVGKKVAFNRTY